MAMRGLIFNIFGFANVIFQIKKKKNGYISHEFFLKSHEF